MSASTTARPRDAAQDSSPEIFGDVHIVVTWHLRPIEIAVEIQPGEQWCSAVLTTVADEYGGELELLLPRDVTFSWHEGREASGCVRCSAQQPPSESQSASGRSPSPHAVGIYADRKWRRNRGLYVWCGPDLVVAALADLDADNGEGDWKTPLKRAVLARVGNVLAATTQDQLERSKS